MDPSLRRVYYSVAGLLTVLWLAMLAWALRSMDPGFASLLSPPAPRPTAAVTRVLSGPPGIHWEVVPVKPGETFSSIAAKAGLRETTLRSLNQKNDGSEPAAGDTLWIPSKDGIYHVAKRGQGLADIAKAYGIPFGVLLKANQKKGDSDLSPEEVLYLPGASYLPKEDTRWIALASLEVTRGFLKPTTGRFADGFGERIHPITKKRSFHEGLDLAPGWRAQVVASQKGKVVFADIRAGYGRLIILDHGGGLASWYAHLDEIKVQRGQWVKRGELIGKVGKTGRVTGPHLHFEIRLNGKPQNPLIYLTQ